MYVYEYFKLSGYLIWDEAIYNETDTQVTSQIQSWVTYALETTSTTAMSRQPYPSQEKRTQTFSILQQSLRPLFLLAPLPQTKLVQRSFGYLEIIILFFLSFLVFTP